MGFAKDVIVWNGELTEAALKSMHGKGPGGGQRGVDVEAVDSLLALFRQPSVGTPEPPPSPSPLMRLVHSTGHGDFPNQNERRADGEEAVIASVLAKGARLLEACASVAERLDVYAEAASLGSSEGLFRWAMLLGFGAEASDVPCGMTINASSSSTHSSDAGPVHPVSRALYALIHAADRGHAAALPAISTLLISGVGVEDMLAGMLHMKTKIGYNFFAPVSWKIPLPREQQIPLRSLRAEAAADVFCSDASEEGGWTALD